MRNGLKKPGEFVKKDEALVTLETDKAAQELVAPEAGIVAEILVQEGETVAVGTIIARLNPEAEASEKPAGTQGQQKKDKQGEVTEAMLHELVVPSVGESVTEAVLAQWLKQAGEAVAKDEAVVVLETDKAAQELVAPVAGVMQDQLFKEEAVVKPGDVLGRIAGGAQTTAAEPSRGAGQSSEKTKSTPQNPVATGEKAPVVMPSAARLVEENRLNSSSLSGTGRGGRITKGDVLANLASGDVTTSVSQAIPVSGPDMREERVPMSRLRQTIARRLKTAQETAAILTTFNEVDMTSVMDLRTRYKEVFQKKHGVKLGFMGFFVKACVHALKAIPSVNAEIDGTDIIYKNHYDMGIAVGTERGLVVPVLRDADQKTLAEIEEEIAALGLKARDGKLGLEDMQGATFTISNGGVYGSLLSTPILNPPQSGILGMHKIQQRPVVVDGQIVARPMMYLALSYDHRLVDGAGAVTFLVKVQREP